MRAEEIIASVRKANVFIDETLIGKIEMVATDLYSFRYAPQYVQSSDAIPLSVSLPLRDKPFDGQELPPYFDNLMMEGSLLRNAEKVFGLSRGSVVDRFKLLLLTCQDAVGAVRVIPIDTSDKPIPIEADENDVSGWEPHFLIAAYEEGCPICLKNRGKHGHCTRELWGGMKQPLLLTDPNDKLAVFRSVVAGASISGAQRKNIFRLSRGVLKPATPSTHIIKPEGDYPEMPANEHLTMCIAREAGFIVPACGLYRIEGNGFLYVIKRFDRAKDGRRLLLEDFAQIMLRAEADKERASIEELAEAIAQVGSSAKIELTEFFRRLLFSFFIGNGDMHLKNWSLLFDPRLRLYKLSPVYDWLNVRASMPEERVESILPLNGKQNGLSRMEYESLAMRFGLNSKLVTRYFGEVKVWREIVKQLLEKSALTDARKERYWQVVEERATRLT